MLTAVAIAVTALCVWASLHRLRLAVAPTSLDLRALAAALRKGGAGRGAIESTLAEQSEGSWERSLALALRSKEAERAGLVNEVLSDLDDRTQRWARVPRVCASVASTTSFLLASMVLRNGLASASVGVEDDFGGVLNATVVNAINVATIGIAGAAFCIAVQMRARRTVKEHLEAADTLVERLERSAPAAGTISK